MRKLAQRRSDVHPATTSTAWINRPSAMAMARVRPRLPLGEIGDRHEHEADRIAGEVSDRSQSGLGGIQTSRASSTGENHPAFAAAFISALSQSRSRSLDDSTRAFMESRFAHDFGHVRIHTDRRAAAATQALEARSFTIGNDIFFSPGAYAPDSRSGRYLLAHEITHVLQQRRGPLTVQRAPKTGTTGGNADPVCDTFDFDITRGLISTLAADYAKTKNTNTRLALIRQIKLIRRCATPEQQQQVRTDLAGAIGTKEEGVDWVEAGTPLGGYTGMYPGFASDIKQRLEALGTSQTYKFGTFDISGSGSTYRARAKAVASGEVPELARTDILYFRGHQYAQYRAPGLFADGSETYGFDLRYIEKVGGFPNVKLLISTSCATLCKEAFDVFHGLFPNAVILGYRKSAPLEGKAVRTALESKVKALARPLLLDEPVDVKAIVSAWESVIEERHKGDTAQLPGYFSGGSIRYWDGAAWQVINPSDNANKCREKGDFSSYYPAPP